MPRPRLSIQVSEEQLAEIDTAIAWVNNTCEIETLRKFFLGHHSERVTRDTFFRAAVKLALNTVDAPFDTPWDYPTSKRS